MAYVSTNEFKQGIKVMLDDAPCNILENEFVKPGKGQAFNRVKLRNLKNGRILEKTFKSGEKLELADVVDVEMQFLYATTEVFNFMNISSFEQLEVPAIVCTEAAKWIKAEDICTLTLWNGQAINVTAPNFVCLKIAQTDPGLRGDTSGGGGKPATLETGAVIRVPLFVQIDDIVKVDTRNGGEYMSREK